MQRISVFVHAQDVRRIVGKMECLGWGRGTDVWAIARISRMLSQEGVIEDFELILHVRYRLDIVQLLERSYT